MTLDLVVTDKHLKLIIPFIMSAEINVVFGSWKRS